MNIAGCESRLETNLPSANRTHAHMARVANFDRALLLRAAWNDNLGAFTLQRPRPRLPTTWSGGAEIQPTLTLSTSSIDATINCGGVDLSFEALPSCVSAIVWRMMPLLRSPISGGG